MFIDFLTGLRLTVRFNSENNLKTSNGVNPVRILPPNTVRGARANSPALFGQAPQIFNKINFLLKIVSQFRRKLLTGSTPAF